MQTNIIFLLSGLCIGTFLGYWIASKLQKPTTEVELNVRKIKNKSNKGNVSPSYDVQVNIDDDIPEKVKDNKKRRLFSRFKRK